MAEHIRIGDVAPRVHYAADGAQTVFIYPFPIFRVADLEVRLDGQVLAGGYTVLGAGASEGGSVVFAAPPAAGLVVALRRRLVIARTSDFQPNGLLRANTLNDDLDHQVAALQEFRDDLGSTIRINPGEVPAGLTCRTGRTRQPRAGLRQPGTCHRLRAGRRHAARAVPRRHSAHHQRQAGGNSLGARFRRDGRWHHR
jgi:hypothetical protein